MNALYFKVSVGVILVSKLIQSRIFIDSLSLTQIMKGTIVVHEPRFYFHF